MPDSLATPSVFISRIPDGDVPFDGSVNQHAVPVQISRLSTNSPSDYFGMEVLYLHLVLQT